MKSMSKLAVFLFFTATSMAVFAQDGGYLEVNTVVQTEEAYTDEAGELRTRLVAAEKVVPGDEVIYTVTFKNVGDEPAENVVITNPISADLTYVAGSAFGASSSVQFSVDGGKNFAAAEDLTVSEDDAARLATPEDYTHVRWLFSNDLAPGAQGVVRFRARLK